MSNKLNEVLRKYGKTVILIVVLVWALLLVFGSSLGKDKSWQPLVDPAQEQTSP
ncbi:MAG: hypothetical protein KAR05_10325 [Candidatus Omnitrophica bacterium]|nr:hypothetical protein [Candidatus Omnitrophota bacterium]